jgi:hypothetical protein
VSDAIAEWVVNTTANHPELIGWAVGIFVVCTLIVNGLRVAWPLEAERPRWVRFLLGLLDFGALNFWRFLQPKAKPQ